MDTVEGCSETSLSRVQEFSMVIYGSGSEGVGPPSPGEGPARNSQTGKDWNRDTAGDEEKEKLLAAPEEAAAGETVENVDGY